MSAAHVRHRIAPTGIRARAGLPVVGLMAALMTILPLMTLGFLGLVAAPAHAAGECAVEGQTPADSVASADVVFAGVVRETTHDAPAEPYVYLVDVTRVWKDDAVVARTVSVRSPSAKTSDCSLGKLEPGTAMIFFAHARGDGFWANVKMGSTEDTAENRDALVAAAGEGRARGAEAKTEQEATLTRVGASAPPRLTRLAAPGLAVALIGLLGLGLIGLTGRRGA